MNKLDVAVYFIVVVLYLGIHQMITGDYTKEEISKVFAIFELILTGIHGLFIFLIFCSILQSKLPPVKPVNNHAININSSLFAGDVPGTEELTLHLNSCGNCFC
jgi:hypothetical protein